MKKFISFALAASMVISMVPATAFASSDLSTSHSNIRTTTNSEFLPYSITQDKGETYREIPYILLEAKSNFNNDEQTFELVLENAEWLEVDGTWTSKPGNSNDDDKLYMEIAEIMQNEKDGVRFEPDGYNPNAKPDDPTTPTPTPDGSTASVEATEKAYRAAIDTLMAAREAYTDASKDAAAYVAARNARDDAKDAKDLADEAVEAAKEKLADAKKQLADAQDAQAIYDKAVALRGESDYLNALNDTLTYSSVAAGKTIESIYSANSGDKDDNGNWIWDADISADVYSAATVVDTDASVTNGQLSPDILQNSSIMLAKDVNDVSASDGEVFLNFQLTPLGVSELAKDSADSLWSAITGMGAAMGSGVSDNIELAVVAGTVTVTDGQVALSAYADITTGFEKGLLTLSTEGDARQEGNKKRAEAAKKALETLAGIEADITEKAEALTKADALIVGYQQAIANAEAELKTAQETAAEKQKALDEKQAALDALASSNQAVATADKALKDAQDARDKAAVNFMSAVRNAGGLDVGTAADRVVTIDGEKGINKTADAKTDADYEKLYKDSEVAGKEAVAEKFDAEVLGTDKKINLDIQRKSDSRIVVTTSGYTFRNGDVLKIPMFVRTTGGIAKVSIDSLDSEFTSEGKTFARTSDGDTKLSVEKVQNFYDSDEIKNLYIEELVPGTLEEGKYITLRVNGDFQFRRGANFKITQITGDSFANTGGEWTEVYTDTKENIRFSETGDKGDEIYIKVPAGKSTKAVQLRIEGLQIVEDGADFGDEATVTVSGAGTSKETITIGNYEDYGVKLTAEDKDLPVIYAGTRASSKYDNQTLKVTIEETVANSFINNRKMELTLPDGVEFVVDNDEIGELSGDIDQITEDFKLYNFAGSDNTVKKAFSVDKDGGKITINSRDLGNASEAFDSSGSNKDRRRKIEFSVHVSAAADFTGDVVMTLSGAAVADREMSATIATVKAPIEVKTDVNELKIDYRNTDIADITLVEPEAGLWAKSDEIYLEGERMSFEDGATAEVVSGDMKLDKLDGDYVDTDDSNDSDVLYIKVDSRSNKTPAEIKISNLSLYMNRSLAAGDYKLKVFGNSGNEFFMNNYHKDGDDLANGFETEKVTVMSDFVKVVTAGREQDDSTFTTQVVVPIGSDVIQAGTREIKLSEMAGGACPSAYINNDGYTMLPVRAVTEALNGIAIVRWDDATKTCTVSFGQRVFSMTVGSKVLNMNGVSTALNAAPEIKDSRVFLPLRDLGYALGLSESQISWDATTQTARLN